MAYQNINKGHYSQQTPSEDQHHNIAMHDSVDLCQDSSADAEALFPGSTSFGLSQQPSDDYDNDAFMSRSHVANHFMSTNSIGNAESGASLCSPDFQYGNTGHNTQQCIEDDAYQHHSQANWRRQQQTLIDTYLPREQHKSRTAVMSGQSADLEDSLEAEEAEPDVEKPYSQLIGEALLSAPNHSMTLQEMYSYIENNTNKVRAKSGKGWQNSVRHNLSQNEAFERVDTQSEGKKGRKNLWRLRPDFAVMGPQSTSRGRKKGPKPAPRSKVGPPQPLRQAAGSEGGKATRSSTERRRLQRVRQSQVERELLLRNRGLRTNEQDPAGLSHAMPLTTSVSMPRYSEHLPLDYHVAVPPYLQRRLQPALGYGDDSRQERRPPFPSGTHGSSSQEQSVRGPQSQLARITLGDLNGTGLFASDGYIPDAAGELSLPTSPSTNHSSGDMFGGKHHRFVHSRPFNDWL